MKQKIAIVGPLPFPVGGVSSHVFRLSSLLQAEGFECSIFDFYPEKIKNVPKDVNHFSSKYTNIFFRFLWLFCKVVFANKNIIHFNFSVPTGFFPFICSLMPKFSRRFYVTLHHGDLLNKFNRSNFMIKMLSRIALKRMDKIIALSHDQKLFYENILSSTAKVDRWLSVIPSGLTTNLSLAPQVIQDIRPLKDGGKDILIVTSGYPNPSYRYELCVDLLKYLSKDISCTLIVCLYGKECDHGYSIDIKESLLNEKKVFVVGEMEPDGFLALLEKADLYVRPSLIDSYGLAITDALDVGTPCLASDVCDRDPRCELFPVNDKHLFFLKAKTIIDRLLSNSQSCIDNFDKSNLKRKILKSYI
jgi:glycosyltransferase involved in cell wall biosynthesis